MTQGVSPSRRSQGGNKNILYPLSVLIGETTATALLGTFSWFPSAKSAVINPGILEGTTVLPCTSESETLLACSCGG